MSSGSNPDDTGNHANWSPSFDWHGCWDSNLSIRDEDHYRTWVDCKVTNNPSEIPSEL